MQKNKRKPAKKPEKRKNVSKTIRNGQTMQTRDEFLESGRGKRNIKPDHPNKTDLYRRVVIVDSNGRDELAVVKLGTGDGFEIKSYQKGKSHYRPYIEILDNKKMPIKVKRGKFELNKPSRDVPKHEVQKIKNKSLYDKETSKSLRKANKMKISKLKKGSSDS